MKGSLTRISNHSLKFEYIHEYEHLYLGLPLIKHLFPYLILHINTLTTLCEAQPAPGLDVVGRVEDPRHRLDPFALRHRLDVAAAGEAVKIEL